MKYLTYFNESRKTSKLNKTYFTKKEIDGFTVIFPGKDDMLDYVIFEFAKKDDIYIRVKNKNDYFAIIKVRDKIPSLFNIKNICQEIARKYGIKDATTDFIYVKRKYITKPKGSEQGTVKIDDMNSHSMTI